MDRPFLRSAVVFLSFLCARGSAPAQRAAPEPQSGYGTDDLQVVTVPMTRFGQNGAGTISTVCCFNQGIGERWPTSGDRTLSAGIDAGLIPNGALLERVDFYFTDEDAVADRNFRALFCRTSVDAATGVASQGACPVDMTSFSAPGETVMTATPAVPVRYTEDIDADGDLDSVSYHVFAAFGVGAESVYDGSMRLRMVRLFYRRQVSPAPAAATFGDVPTSHPFFQFVEALAASGITAGCGSGNYCPNAPLTRGQMAVFLAKALGLHWPGPEVP